MGVCLKSTHALPRRGGPKPLQIVEAKIAPQLAWVNRTKVLIAAPVGLVF